MGARSALGLCLAAALWGCNPATTRPPFAPYPEALTATLNSPPARVAAEIAAWLAAESIAVRRHSPVDAYVETEWYDTRRRTSARGDRDVPDLAAAIKIRCWADPYVPGTTRLTVEAVHRPRYDPSLPPRDLEVPVPEDHDGHRIARRLLEALGQKFGAAP